MTREYIKKNININTNILKVGMEFQTHADMCRKLGIDEPFGGSEKKTQMKELQRHFDWRLEPTFGNRKKVIVTEIYDEPKPIIDGRGKHPNCWGNNKKK